MAHDLATAAARPGETPPGTTSTTLASDAPVPL